MLDEKNSHENYTNFGHIKYCILAINSTFQGEGLFTTLKQELDQYQILSVDTQEMVIQYLSTLKEESQSLVLSNSVSQAFCEATEI